jgi:hypothetical protein
MGMLWRYSATPGERSSFLTAWPEGSALRLSPDRPTLVIFLHPKCPCSRASVAELAVALAHAKGGLDAQGVFVQPAGTPDGWADTDLWREAGAVPGVMERLDRGATEASRFHAKTSGDTFVFAPDGRLLFHGGITTARGEEGDSAGLAAIKAIADRQSPPIAQTRAFGCPLFTPAKP